MEAVVWVGGMIGEVRGIAQCRPEVWSQIAVFAILLTTNCVSSSFGMFCRSYSLLEVQTHVFLL